MVSIGVRGLGTSSGLGILISGMSCSVAAVNQNPGGSDRHTCMPWGSVAASPSQVCALRLGSPLFTPGRACGCHLGLLGLAKEHRPLPLRVRAASGRSSASSSSGISKMSSSTNHIRLAMHPLKIPGSATTSCYKAHQTIQNSSVGLWLEQGFSPSLFTQMSWEPLRSPGSRKSLWHRALRLGGGSHQPIFSN